MAPTPWQKKPSYIIPLVRYIKDNNIISFTLDERKLICTYLGLDMKSYKNGKNEHLETIKLFALESKKYLDANNIVVDSLSIANCIKWKNLLRKENRDSEARLKFTEIKENLYRCNKIYIEDDSDLCNCLLMGDKCEPGSACVNRYICL